MAALVAAFVIQATDRTPWFTAILADRCRQPAMVLLASLVALAAGYCAAALAGALIGPRLTPEARELFLAVSLVLAGAGAFAPIKRPDRFAGSRLGSFATTLLGVISLATGDRTQFVVATLAARSAIPGMAAAGAFIGALAIVVPATIAGEAARAKLPITAIRFATGVLLLIVGAVSGLGALRLI